MYCILQQSILNEVTAISTDRARNVQVHVDLPAAMFSFASATPRAVRNNSQSE